MCQVKLKDEKESIHSITWEDGYEKLAQDDKNKIEQVLFLMDKFCVGDEVYHELTMYTEDLPKSYLVKQLRSNLNKTYTIERTRGKFPGATINFTSTLQYHINDTDQNIKEILSL